MSRHRLSSGTNLSDLDGTLGVLRDNLGRADAFISAAEELIERPGGGVECVESDEEAGLSLRRNHLAHLIEAAKLAVRAAAYTGQDLEALAHRRRGA